MDVPGAGDAAFGGVAGAVVEGEIGHHHLVADHVVGVLRFGGEQVQARLRESFARAPRAKVIGFTEQMPELLAAADVLIHSTAGLTAFEARVRGCQLISYGWGVAHIRLNNEAYERFALAEVAADRSALADALARALSRPRTAELGYGARPSAAAEILALAGVEQ